MKWQPLDRDLSFAGTWNWLPQKDEEELLGPTTFDEAFRELLDQHRRADVNGCWESAELPHSAETASAAGSVATTAVGSTSPVHFFIGDHDDGESTSSLMQSRVHRLTSGTTRQLLSPSSLCRLSQVWRAWA